MPRLTKRTVDALSPGEREQIVIDEELPGFGVRVWPSGQKVYFLRYRLGGRGSAERRLSLGKHGVVKTDAARRRAKQILGDVAHGRDPAGEERAKRKARTVAEAADTWLGELEGRRRVGTVREYRRIVDRHVRASLGRKPIAELTRAEVAKWHHAMGKTPYQANRALAVMSSLCSWALRHGYRPDAAGNPCQMVDRFPESARDRFLSEAELALIGEALTHAEARGESRYTVAAIRLLVFTGARRDEIRRLRWREVDFGRSVLHLAESKTGRKPIFLPPPALALLEELPRLTGNEFVFPAARAENAPVTDLEKPWQRIRADATVLAWRSSPDPTVAGLVAELEADLGRRPTMVECDAAARRRRIILPIELRDVRLHDLRHTHASAGAGLGLSLPVIGRLLGHSQAQTTARYAHLASDPVRQAADRIGDHLARALSGEPPAGEVVQVGRGRRNR